MPGGLDLTIDLPEPVSLVQPVKKTHSLSSLLPFMLMYVLFKNSVPSQRTAR